jgi:ribosomal protein S16
VRLRLQRFGVRNNPFYRIVAADSRWPRDGKHLEMLGTYNPKPNQHNEKIVTLNYDRIKYWLVVGAQPSVCTRCMCTRCACAFVQVCVCVYVKCGFLASRRSPYSSYSPSLLPHPPCPFLLLFCTGARCKDTGWRKFAPRKTRVQARCPQKGCKGVKPADAGRRRKI